MIEKLKDCIRNPPDKYKAEEVADLGVIVRNNRDKINELVDEVNKQNEWIFDLQNTLMSVIKGLTSGNHPKEKTDD